MEIKELKSPEYYGFSRFKEFRDIQKKVIPLVVENFNKYNYIVAELPTGVGKSLIAMVVSKVITDGWKDGKTYVVVSTKTLQDQYMREFGIPTVKGRNNFKCLIHKNLTVDKAPCNIRKCSLMGECPYYVQRDIAISSPVSIHNYEYFLTSMNFTNLWEKAKLVVFDEAHTMDSHISSFVTIKLPKSDVKLGTNILGSLINAREDISYYISDISDQLEDTTEGSEEYEQLVLLYQYYNNLYRKILMIINRFENNNFIIDETRKYYIFRPVWSSSFADMYFSHGEKFLMMSATIGDIDVFCRILGLDNDKVLFIRGGSVFKPENRPVYVIPGKSINHKNVNDMLPGIVDKIDKIISMEDGSGVIHVPSYTFGEYVYNNSKYRDIMIFHSSRDRDMAISRFVNSDDRVILVSPSVHTGLDFKYDIARWQIITKVLYADLSDRVVYERAKSNRMWYLQDAINRVVQAYGRIVRAYDDWGKTYILDGNAIYLLNRYPDMFPKWFREAVEIVDLGVSA